jgi:hypothetical protein
MSLTFVISNTNYSSWSELRHVGIVLDEVRMPLYGSNFKYRVATHSPVNKVPVLVDCKIPVREARLLPRMRVP